MNNQKYFLVSIVLGLAVISVFAAMLLNDRSIKTAIASPNATINLFVATNGDDVWSGAYCDPNLGKTDGPLATLEGARNKIRALKAANQFTKPINVYLRGGTYYLSRTFELVPEDSGTADKPITYQSYPNEKAVISGGKSITSVWSGVNLNGHQVYETQVDKNWQFNSLFVNGKRAIRARAPNEDATVPYYLIADVPVIAGLKNSQCTLSTAANFPQCTSFKYSGKEFSQWSNLQDAEVSVSMQYTNPHVKLQSVDEAQKTVHFLNYPEKPFSFDYNSICNNDDKPFPCTGPSGKLMARYFVENALELLDNPGEWYLNKVTGNLYYMPLAGEDISKSEVIASRLDTVISIDGGSSGTVSFINLKDLAIYNTNRSDDAPPGAMGGSGTFWGPKTQAAVNYHRAENCAFEHNIVAHAGKNGIAVLASKIQVIGNEIYDTGAAAIQIGSPILNIAQDWWGATDSRDIYNNWGNDNTISDNDIHDFSIYYYTQPGISLRMGNNNTVSHNEIHDGPYLGILSGVYLDNIERGSDNVISYNDIHNVMQWLNDGGAIYTMGNRPNTLISNNVIHDILLTSNHLYNSRIWGIYLDADSKGMTVSDNLVYRVQTSGIFLHENFGNVVTNNIFVDGLTKSQIWIIATGWQGRTPGGNEITHNIVSYAGGAKLLSVDGEYPPAKNFAAASSSLTNSDYNLFWNPDPAIRSNADLWNLAAWQSAYGFDAHSQEADPLFKNVSSTADYKKGDFDLNSNSPAFSLGFENIDFSQIGPRLNTQLPLSVVCPVFPKIDTIPPIRSSGQPSGILSASTTQTTISLQTDGNAVCKYATSSGMDYASMANNFSATGGVFHSKIVTGFASGNNYIFYVRCQDSEGNIDEDDYPISFSVAGVVMPMPSLGPVSLSVGGSIIKLSGGSAEVYIINNGKKELIPSADIFNARGYSWSSIQIVDRAIFDQYPDGPYVSATIMEIHKGAVLLGAEGRDEVYALTGGKLHWIPNMSVFDQYQYQASEIKTVAGSEIDKYSKINLVKAIGDDKVYYLTDRYQKRWIKSPEIFNSYNLRWGDILEITPEEMNVYNDNILIKTSGSPDVYLFKDGSRQKIVSAQQFFDLHYLWDDIAIVNQKEMDGYALR